MLTFNPRSVTEVRKFGNWTFAEGGQDSDEVNLSDDLMAIGISSEFDTTTVNAASPYNHGVSDLFSRIVADVDGDEEHIRSDGYGANLMSMMYSRRKAQNMILGAVEANALHCFHAILPCQIPSDRGKVVNIDFEFATEAVLDSVGANIAINDSTIEVYAIFGSINDETWVLRGADNFGQADFEKRISGKSKYIEQMAIYGDEEIAVNIYTVINQLNAFIGSRKLVSLNWLSMTGWGSIVCAPIPVSLQFLRGAYAAFYDSNVHRGLLVPYPTTLISGDLQNLMDRATADNVYTCALLSMPVEKGGEEELDKKAEPTTLKRSV